jgi:hypothetical protein
MDQWSKLTYDAILSLSARMSVGERSGYAGTHAADRHEPRPHAKPRPYCRAAPASCAPAPCRHARHALRAFSHALAPGPTRGAARAPGPGLAWLLLDNTATRQASASIQAAIPSLSEYPIRQCQEHGTQCALGKGPGSSPAPQDTEPALCQVRQVPGTKQGSSFPCLHTQPAMRAVPGTWARPCPCTAPASGSRASRPGIASPGRGPHGHWAQGVWAGERERERASVTFVSIRHDAVAPCT